MSATAKILAEPLHEPQLIDATLTSKGQITVPAEVRRLLRLKTGDKLTFAVTPEAVSVLRKPDENLFDKFRGTEDWLPDSYQGREGILRYFRELRGHDEQD